MSHCLFQDITKKTSFFLFLFLFSRERQKIPQKSQQNKEKSLKWNLSIDHQYLILVITAGFEPATNCLEDNCSIRLSYVTF